MNRKYLYAFFCGLSFLFAGACAGVEDNYQQYLQETVYSSRIMNLRVHIGIERVLLAWDNPEDQVAKKILIRYSEMDQVDSLFFENMIDSCVVDKLSSGGSFDFTVYTIDRFGNRSIGEKITALPISQMYIDRLEMPVPDEVETETGYFFLMWKNIRRNDFIRYTGEISYWYMMDGQKYEYQTYKADENNEWIEVDNWNNKELEIHYSMKFVPIMGGQLTADTITMTGSRNIPGLI
ncbi:MAG: DUF4998 domain-containing protein [Bacteroidales bacterium]